MNTLLHFTNRQASKEYWIDHEMILRTSRIIKIKKIEYKIKNNTTKGFKITRDLL